MRLFGRERRISTNSETANVISTVESATPDIRGDCADDAAQITFVFEDRSGDVNCRARHKDTRTAQLTVNTMAPNG